MIIIPRVLTGLLLDLGEVERKALALSYARHVLDACSRVLTNEEIGASREYLTAAESFLVRKGSIEDLGVAHTRYFSSRNANTKLSGEVTWTAFMAVQICCQRQMEEARIVLYRSRKLPSVADFAKDAQKTVARCVVSGVADVNYEIDVKSPDSFRQATWAEAKWQLIRLIESVEIPEDAIPFP